MMRLILLLFAAAFTSPCSATKAVTTGSTAAAFVFNTFPLCWLTLN